MGAATALTVEFPEIFKVQTIYYGINYAHMVVFDDILINSLRKKYRLLVIARNKYNFLNILIYCISQKYIILIWQSPGLRKSGLCFIICILLKKN